MSRGRAVPALYALPQKQRRRIESRKRITIYHIDNARVRVIGVP